MLSPLSVDALRCTGLSRRLSPVPGVGAGEAARRSQTCPLNRQAYYQVAAGAARLQNVLRSSAGRRRDPDEALKHTNVCMKTRGLPCWSCSMHRESGQCMWVQSPSETFQKHSPSGRTYTPVAGSSSFRRRRATSIPSNLAQNPGADVPGIPLCDVNAAGTSIRSFSSQQPSSSVSKVSGNGFSVLHTSVRWGPRSLDFFVSGVDPDGAKEGKRSALSAIQAVKWVRPDLVLLGLGYLDREKIFETFSREALLRSRELEPLDQVLSRDNGQFIPVLQHLLIYGTPYYVVGRDRLVEMGALGRELLWRPLELYSLLWKLIRSKKQKEPVTPSLKKVLSEDSSEFCLLKIHQYLLEWTGSQLSVPEPVHGFAETGFAEKWLVGRNKSECQLRMRAKQFEMARLPLPSNLKSKPNWRILIVCDAALEERLAERLSRELPKLKEESPMFGRMFELENTSSTRFHLCLMIYLILPMATLCRLLWKLVRKAYLEYWVKGSAVSVSGDEVLSRFGDQVGVHMSESDKRNSDLEIVEARWLGLKHSVRDKSRD